MRKTTQADRAVRSAMISIDSDRKDAERRAAVASAAALQDALVTRVRGYAPLMRGIERDAAASRAAAFAATPRGMRLLAERR